MPGPERISGHGQLGDPAGFRESLQHLRSRAPSMPNRWMPGPAPGRSAMSWAGHALPPDLLPGVYHAISQYSPPMTASELGDTGIGPIAPVKASCQAQPMIRVRRSSQTPTAQTNTWVLASSRSTIRASSTWYPPSAGCNKGTDASNRQVTRLGNGLRVWLDRPGSAPVMESCCVVLFNDNAESHQDPGQDSNWSPCDSTLVGDHAAEGEFASAISPARHDEAVNSARTAG